MPTALRVTYRVNLDERDTSARARRIQTEHLAESIHGTSFARISASGLWATLDLVAHAADTRNINLHGTTWESYCSFFPVRMRWMSIMFIANLRSAMWATGRSEGTPLTLQFRGCRHVGTSSRSGWVSPAGRRRQGPVIEAVGM
jgi:hypothetical protein